MLKCLLQLGNGKVFGFSVLTGFMVVMAMAAYDHWTSLRSQDIRPLKAGISVTEQLFPRKMASVTSLGFASVVDLRPDGESTDEPSSAEMEQLAKANKLAFHYIPVPHGDIPESAVIELQKVLSQTPRPVLLYCRSGRRAVRTWSLVEASRKDGPSVEEIISTAGSAGQDVSDLKEDLQNRIAAREK